MRIVNGLGDAQAVPVDHQKQDLVAGSVRPALAASKQALDLNFVQEVLRPFMGVGRRTLDVSPLGHRNLLPGTARLSARQDTTLFTEYAIGYERTYQCR